MPHAYGNVVVRSMAALLLLGFSIIGKRFAQVVYTVRLMSWCGCQAH